MSVHIDEVRRVNALLIGGNWLGVDPGTLQRHMPVGRSSVTSAVVYRWTFAASEFMAAASDVQAVRLLKLDDDG